MTPFEWVAAGVALVGATIGTVSAVQGSQQQAEAAKTESRYREEESKSIQESAAYEERQFRRRAQLLLGKQTAMTAAAGLDITSGSPLFNELDTVGQAELEALNIRRTGFLSSRGKELESRLAGYKSSIARGQIPYEIGSGLTQGARTVLGSWARTSNRGTRPSQYYDVGI